MKRDAVQQNVIEYTRWAAFEHAVLAKVSDPDKCRKVISRRQTEIDDDSKEADLVAAYVRSKLQRAKLDPDTCCVYWTSAEVTEWLVAATGAKIPVNRATPYLRALSIPELRYTKKNGVPGWIWRGARAKKSATSVVFRKLKYIAAFD